MKKILLFKVKGKAGYFSKEAIERPARLGDLHEVSDWRAAEDKGDYYEVNYVNAQKKPYKVYDNLEQTKFHYIYSYGMDYYFDTEEERENYKLQYHIKALRNGIKRAEQEIQAATARIEKYTAELKALGLL